MRGSIERKFPEAELGSGRRVLEIRGRIVHAVTAPRSEEVDYNGRYGNDMQVNYCMSSHRRQGRDHRVAGYRLPKIMS